MYDTIIGGGPAAPFSFNEVVAQPRVQRPRQAQVSQPQPKARHGGYLAARYFSGSLSKAALQPRAQK